MTSEDQVKGPAMLAMTAALKAPPQRISKIGNDITLPATFQLTHIVGAFLGAVVGLLFFLMFIAPFFRLTILNFLFSVFIGGFIGVILVTWSPLQGESFAKWLGLSVNSIKAKKTTIDGEPVKAYIGIARLNFTAAGSIRIYPGAINVPAGSADERGVLVTRYEKNQELSDINHSTYRKVNYPSIYDGFDPVKPPIGEDLDITFSSTSEDHPLK